MNRLQESYWIGYFYGLLTGFLGGAIAALAVFAWSR